MNIIDFLRQYKIGPFSIFDFVTAYAGLFLLAPLIIKLFVQFNLRITKSSIMWLTLPFSIFIHILIGTNTPLTKMFLDPNEYYLVKIIILFMLWMGLSTITLKKNAHR